MLNDQKTPSEEPTLEPSGSSANKLHERLVLVGQHGARIDLTVIADPAKGEVFFLADSGNLQLTFTAVNVRELAGVLMLAAVVMREGDCR